MPTIVHFDLPVDNIDRAKKFYEELFDWKFNNSFGLWQEDKNAK